jgi:hypothetical protein
MTRTRFHIASQPTQVRCSQRISNPCLNVTKPASTPRKARQRKREAFTSLAPKPLEVESPPMKVNLNAPTQVSGLVKVFDTVSLILRLYAPQYYL